VIIDRENEQSESTSETPRKLYYVAKVQETDNWEDEGKKIS